MNLTYERGLMLEVMKHSDAKEQAGIAIEEMAELTFALVKHFFRGLHRTENLLEEIADVEVMLHQLKIVIEREVGYEVYNDIVAIRVEKLKRLQKRLNDGIFSVNSSHPREIPPHD